MSERIEIEAEIWGGVHSGYGPVKVTIPTEKIEDVVRRVIGETKAANDAYLYGWKRGYEEGRFESGSVTRPPDPAARPPCPPGEHVRHADGDRCLRCGMRWSAAEKEHARLLRACDMLGVKAPARPPDIPLAGFPPLQKEPETVETVEGGHLRVYPYPVTTLPQTEHDRLKRIEAAAQRIFPHLRGFARASAGYEAHAAFSMTSISSDGYTLQYGELQAMTRQLAKALGLEE